MYFWQKSMQRLSEKMQFPFFISPGIAEAMFM